MAAPVDAHYRTRGMNERSIPLAADLYCDLLESVPSARKDRLVDYWPGLLLTGIAALAAAWIADHYGAPMMLMGLLIGLALNFANTDVRLHPGLGLASKDLLRWGIVLAGAQVTFGQIGALGLTGFGAIVGIMALVLGAGWLAARTLRLGDGYGILAGGAVAICGASAALALSSLLGERRASQAHLTMTLVTVAAASAFAMSIYPVIAQYLDLSDRQAGFMIGASIHDVAQALGAGYGISPEAGETATIVKLTRVTLLGPLLLLISLFLAQEPGEKRASIPLPWFVLGFLLLALINSYVKLPVQVQEWARYATSAFLLLAVVANGIRSPMQMLVQQGWRSIMPVAVATLVSFILSMLACALI
jgi:uncharacterized integral membrane protein (TIGR00698 family)